ncbi:putative membrane protein [Pedobacter sp. UYEF25]
MTTSKTYSFTALGFSIIAFLLFVFGGNFFVGIPTIDLFFALVALAYITAFIGLMKNTKSFISWLVIVLVSTLVVCVISFISNF